MSYSPKILVAVRPALYEELFIPEADDRLRALADVTFQPDERNWTSAELAAHLPGYEAVITSWGTPPFTDEVLAAADRLKLIAHSAGSIKALLPLPVFEHGTRVTHAAAAMAPAVAELTLLLIMLSLRRIHQVDQAMKQGAAWNAVKDAAMGHELAGQRIGIVGAGYTGRSVIRVLKALGAELWVCDPYLTEDRAAALEVTKVDLATLLTGCPIVTLQAPSTDATYRMIGAQQFAMLQDGAIFINTARTHLIDEAALLAELQSGRIVAALDVFEQEPLPEDSPFRQLENVILSPHIAAATYETRKRQGQIVAEEVARFFTAGELYYEVTRDMLDIMG